MRYSVINIRSFVNVVNDISGKEIKLFMKCARSHNTSMSLFIIRGQQYFNG